MLHLNVKDRGLIGRRAVTTIQPTQKVRVTDMRTTIERPDDLLEHAAPFEVYFIRVSDVTPWTI